jgi:hypothetical protein
LQRSAISSVEASDSGHSANASAISSLDFRKNSFVSNVIFGWASVDFVCTQSSAVWWW